MKNSTIMIATLAAVSVFGARSTMADEACPASSTAIAVQQTQPKDIVDTAVESGSFNVLAKALTAANLVDVLKGKGPFTVFAPTDEAFAKLPEGTLESLLKPESLDTLTSILTYHVVAGKISAEQVVDLTGASTVNGQRIDITSSKAGVMVDGAKVVTTDIVCSNGIIHVIDSVILPSSKNAIETADSAKTFTTLLTAVKAAGLAEVLNGKGPFTIFAPTDEAFAKVDSKALGDLLKPENKNDLVSLLKFHVISGRVYSADALKAGTAKTLNGASVKIMMHGDTPMVQDAQLIKLDLDCSNAVIHVIDSVLFPVPAGE